MPSIPESLRSESVRRIIRDLYALVAELEQLYPTRRFTLDGHLVVSMGEVLAADLYGLSLLPMVEETHDAVSGHVRVQIKATQRDSVGLRSEPDHLLVLRLLPSGSVEEIYNGPGSLAWAAAGKMQRNGQRQVGIAKLRKLMAGVAPQQRLPRVASS